MCSRLTSCRRCSPMHWTGASLTQTNYASAQTQRTLTPDIAALHRPQGTTLCNIRPVQGVHICDHCPCAAERQGAPHRAEAPPTAGPAAGQQGCGGRLATRSKPAAPAAACTSLPKRGHLCRQVICDCAPSIGEFACRVACCGTAYIDATLAAFCWPH